MVTNVIFVIISSYSRVMGFPGGSVVKILPAKRCEFDPSVRKIP